MNFNKSYIQSINCFALVTFICLIPLIQLFSYLYSGKTLQNQEIIVDFSAYLLLIFFIYFLIIPKQNFWFRIITIFFVFFYTFFYRDFSLSNKIGYILPFIVTIQALTFLPKIILNRIQIKFVNFSSILIFYVIIFSYILTLNKHEEGGRIYFDGFIIPHQFVYYLAIFSYFFTKKKMYLHLILPIILVFIIGTRTGLILTIISILGGSGITFNLKKILIYTILFTLFYFIFIFFTKYSNEKIQNLQNNSLFESFSGITKDLSLDDLESAKVTSGRSLFLLYGINEISTSSFATNLLGRGPRSSYNFNDFYLGLNVWFHNDFMEVLFTFGFVTLFIYIYKIFTFSFFYKSKYILSFILIACFVNGFFFYSTIVLLSIFTLSNIKQNNIINNISNS